MISCGIVTVKLCAAVSVPGFQTRNSPAEQNALLSIWLQPPGAGVTELTGKDWLFPGTRSTSETPVWLTTSVLVTVTSTLIPGLASLVNCTAVSSASRPSISVTALRAPELRRERRGGELRAREQQRAAHQTPVAVHRHGARSRLLGLERPERPLHGAAVQDPPPEALTNVVPAGSGKRSSAFGAVAAVEVLPKWSV